MSAINVIKTIEKILLMYRSMNQLAKQKTEIIKKGDIASLQTLISEEKRHIQAIQKFEKQLLSETETFLKQNEVFNGSLTITECIEASSTEEKQALIDLKLDLEEQISLLKKQNILNQQLIDHSLQFVNMSLDMILPAIDSFNYERPNQTQDMGEDKRSIFDSKA